MEKKDNQKTTPLGYIITCRTYGTWLHGDERKSVDPKNNKFGTPRIEHNPILQRSMKNL